MSSSAFVSSIPISRFRTFLLTRLPQTSTHPSSTGNRFLQKPIIKASLQHDSSDIAVESSILLTNQSSSLTSTSSTIQPERSISAKHIRKLILTFVLFTVFRCNPVLASVEQTAFISGLTASFALVLASEIGDKTFFISALLSMKYSRILVLIGTMLALASMTVISVGIGQIFHALPASLNSSIPFDDYAAVALLLWFGYQNIRDGLQMKQDEDDELQDAKGVVDEQTSASFNNNAGLKVVAQTSSLVFFAEWGDKSMLATVALAAAKSPFGVIVGGITGHFVASLIAVIGGSFLGKFISEKNARLIGGVLFLVFAVLTIMGIY